MKPYLIDVPVRVNIWIRPECQKKQFDIIKKARPSILFLQSDGGRNEIEWTAIKKNRKLFEEEIDWECKIYKIYENENQGLYTMSKKSSDFIWGKVDRCIFLEDDQVPSVSFFKYCAELLEKYKDDLRIECICGMNQLGVYDDVNTDYFFSRQGSIWGCATWKRSHDMRDYSFAYSSDPYVMKLLNQRTKKNKIFRKRYIAYSKSKVYEGHVAGGEFFTEFAMYGYNQLQIIPKKNLISNIGATEKSAHADRIDLLPKGIRKVFNMKTYELEFPLKHPKFIIPDVFFEKKRNRIMAYNMPIVSLFRKIERFFLLSIHGNLLSKFKSKIIYRVEK